MSPPASPQDVKITPPRITIPQAFSQRPEAESRGDARKESPLREWTPAQVANWMFSTDFDTSIVERFYSNDISGATLIDLQYDDLKELGIASFGQRHRLWNEIRDLKRNKLSDVPPTPSSEPCYTPASQQEFTQKSPGKECSSPDSPDNEPSKQPLEVQHRARRARRADDIISPAESASIVAIEQLLPKPHNCSKGENCTKWQKQQKKLAKIAKEFPLELQQIHQSNASPTDSGIGQSSVIVPSVIASSDLLGPGLPPVRLEEDNLRVVQVRDPQENVRQFLSFQHLDHSPQEDGAKSPFEMFPPLSPPQPQVPHSNLRSLPKLTIPAAPAADPTSPSQTAIPASAFRRGTPITAMDLRNPHSFHNIYRLGSPASDMDVPVTAIPLGPIERDVSSSVPPDMRFGAVDPISRSTSRGENRALTGNPTFAPPPVFAAGSPQRTKPGLQRSMSVVTRSRRPNLDLAPVSEVQAPLSTIDAADERTPTTLNDVNHAGWMKKRKTKMLRHEWHENHFRLQGTHLAMHKDENAQAVLDCIDVDDYAVACSSLSSNKLNAAFKSLKLSGKKKDGDAGAFAFQLVPATEKKRILSAATGKTHHFAVKNRDERIDWMRELMLAKALKQKGDGYEINVNGNMV
ncbi:hypothetical protein MMC09_005993 [Bachmanniomyces sp. S44760]|nr:hypothetical protein [Bachmanniomyces sp. S44760]